MAAETFQWLILDGYGFDDPFQDELSLNATRLLVFDDFGHATHPRADLVVSPGWAISNDAERPTADPNSDGRLSGPDYVLIRDEFKSLSANDNGIAKRGPRARRRIVITLGGSDPQNFTAPVLQQVLQHVPETWEIDVVLGPCNRHRPSLVAIAKSARQNVRLLTSGREFASRLVGADLVITSASTTTFELAFLRVPFIAIQTATNQDRLTAALGELDGRLVWSPAEIAFESFAQTLQSLSTQDSARASLQSRLSGFVDGQGTERIVRRMQAADFRVRAATPSDARTVWTWRNNPEVRAVSFQSAPIAWPEHERWYHQRLADPACEILIMTDRLGQDVGQVRLERNGERSEYVISICMAPGMRGRGLGTALIEAVCRRIRARDGRVAIRAIIKPENGASQAAFRKAGFVPVRSTTVRNQVALQFQWPATSVEADQRGKNQPVNQRQQPERFKRAG